jgi:hypothetical protein
LPAPPPLAQPGLEALLECPAGNGAFSTVYKRQSSALDEYIEAQPFAEIKQLLFDILLGQRELKSAWNPALDQGTIMVGGPEGGFGGGERLWLGRVHAAAPLAAWCGAGRRTKGRPDPRPAAAAAAAAAPERRSALPCNRGAPSYPRPEQKTTPRARRDSNRCRS